MTLVSGPPSHSRADEIGSRRKEDYCGIDRTGATIDSTAAAIRDRLIDTQFLGDVRCLPFSIIDSTGSDPFLPIIAHGLPNTGATIDSTAAAIRDRLIDRNLEIN
jgi:hypothetical protein